MALGDLKTRFFAAFRDSAGENWATKLEIWENDPGLTFDEILKRGRQHHTDLLLASKTRESSGVTAMIGNGKGGRGKGSKRGSKGAGRGTDFGGGRGRGRGGRRNQPVTASGTTQNLQGETDTADTRVAVVAAKENVQQKGGGCNSGRGNGGDRGSGRVHWPQGKQTVANGSKVTVIGVKKKSGHRVAECRVNLTDGRSWQWKRQRKW